MDVIDCLPPGLYEMVISPRPTEVPRGRLRHRRLDSPLRGPLARRHSRARAQQPRGRPRIRRRGSAVGAEPLNSTGPFVQPFVRALANQPAADLAQALNPLRLSYTIFADSNPWMNGVQELAASVAAARKPAAADNPFLKLQTQVSDQITAALDAYRVARDQWAEQMFFGFYGSPFVQALLGLNAGSEVRPFPGSFARKAGGATGPGGRVRGEASDRRIRRSADPGGALCHRSPPDARPAMRARFERRAPAAHASVACRVQGGCAGPGLSAPA